MSFCIVVSHSKDNVDRATVGLTLATAALETGEKVMVAFASEGVRIAVRGYADDMNNGEPFKPIKQLLREILERGGTLHACTPCMKKRNIKDTDLLPGVHLITGTDLIRLLKQADRTIQL